MPLSVLSVLTRQGVDPWEEAAKLAHLPRASATKRLISLIAAAPGNRWTYQDAGTLSDRLIALLPRPTDFIVPVRHGVRAITASRFAMWAILVAFILAIQLVMISYQPTVHVDPVTCARQGTVHPLRKAPKSGLPVF